ncbi:hypothetical protein LGK99_11565 [Clostridium algidicarnis]|uniref:hypothetical protein n=1 Tax=Clostridium algidicarnis TaxID=37659 RepID=UPI001CF3988C|nr:hypothetical protein [Clostridium algidicarnis]MCB2287716.1 hypothetical protein [Clostridium algidicarnis]
MYNNLKKIFTLTVLTLPIISQYNSAIPGLSIGDLILLLLVIFIVINLMMEQHNANIQRKVINPFLVFIIYMVLGSLVSSITQYYASTIDISVRTLRYIFYIFCATFISKIYFDLDLFIKWYRRLVIFVTAFLFIQLILFEFKGYILMGTIPGLEISNIGYSEETMRNLYSYFYRPSSIFLEPGYFVQFTLPYLAYALFGNAKESKTKLIEALLLSTGLVLTTSGQGIILTLFIWGMWFFTKFYNVKSKKINLRFILGLCVFIAVIPLVIKIPIVERSVARLFGSPTSSSSSRIFRGYHVYNQLEPIYKFIGVGYGNIGAYIIYKGIYTIYDVGLVQSEYMNSIAYILVNLGIIGFLLMVWIFVYLRKNTVGFHRICLYILILLSGVSTIFISSGIVFYLPIILSGINKQNQNKEYINNLIN